MCNVTPNGSASAKIDVQASLVIMVMFAQQGLSVVMIGKIDGKVARAQTATPKLFLLPISHLLFRHPELLEARGSRVTHGERIARIDLPVYEWDR